MRTLLIAVVGWLALAGVGRAAFPSTTGLIDCWEMEAASGNETGVHGSIVLAETGSPDNIGTAAGKLSNARDFELDGTEWLSVADSGAISHGTDFTVTMWFYMETNNTSLAGKWVAGGNQREFGVDIGSSRALMFVSPDGTGTGNSTVTANSFGNLSTATWYFLWVEHDATNDRIRISINDGAKDSTAHTTGAFDGTAGWSVGSYTTAGNDSYDGLIDQVTYWSRLLSDAEITALYNSGNGVAYSAGGGGSTVRRQVIVVGSLTRPYQPTDIDWRCSPFAAFFGALAL